MMGFEMMVEFCQKAGSNILRHPLKVRTEFMALKFGSIRLENILKVALKICIILVVSMDKM